jgi:hypothetical protein
MNARIENGLVQQMMLVTFQKHPHHLFEMARVLLGKRVLEKIFHAAPDMGVNELIRQRGEFEMGARLVDRIGQIMPGIGKCAIQVEHDEIDFPFFHLI